MEGKWGVRKERREGIWLEKVKKGTTRRGRSEGRRGKRRGKKVKKTEVERK